MTDAGLKKQMPYFWLLTVVAVAFAVGGIAFDLLVNIKAFDGSLILLSTAGGFASIQALCDSQNGMRRRALIWAIIAAFFLVPSVFATYAMIRGFGVPV